MTKSVNDRYATAESFITDLDALVRPAVGPSLSKSVVLKSVVGVILVASAAGAWVYQASEPVVQLEAVPSPGLSADAHDKVQRLLDSAQMHEIVGRYVTPPGSNALDAYRIILEIDPMNAFASGEAERLANEHGDK